MNTKDAGFSFIELMVVAGLLSISAYFGMSFFGSMTKSGKSSEQNFGITDFTRDIESSITPEKCSLVMKDSANAPIALSFPVGMTLGTNLFSGNSRLSIQSLFKNNTLLTSINADAAKGAKVSAIWLEDAVFDGDQIDVDRTVSPVIESTVKVFNATLFIQLTLGQGKSTTFNYSLRLKADPATGIISSCGLVNHRTAAEELEKSLQINCANLGRVYNALSTPKCPAP